MEKNDKKKKIFLFGILCFVISIFFSINSFFNDSIINFDKYTKIAEKNVRENNFRIAYEYFHKAYNIKDILPHQKCYILSNMGILSYQMRNREKALNYMNESIRIGQNLKGKYKIYLMTAYTKLGHIYKTEKDNDKALANYTSAYNSFSNFKSLNEKDIKYALRKRKTLIKNMIEIYKDRNDLKNAISLKNDLIKIEKLFSLIEEKNKEQ